MKVDLRKKLCKRFCVYYRPSRNEELACLGFTIIKRLIQRGRKFSFSTVDRNLTDSTRKTLMQRMCPACPFYQNDCDFILKHSMLKDRRREISERNTEEFSRDSQPCGGFLLLCNLLEGQTINIDDIENII